MLVVKKQNGEMDEFRGLNINLLEFSQIEALEMLLKER